MKIGLVPMSAKPYHLGHDLLVRIASRECDEIKVYVSMSDRDNVTAAKMSQIWSKLILHTLPSNVEVIFVKNPVRSVWDTMGAANEAQSSDIFSIYSDDEDVTRNYPVTSLAKYTGFLYQSNQITLRAIQRSQTAVISGTQMRQFLKIGDKENFIKNLPLEVDGDVYWSMLVKQR